MSQFGFHITHKSNVEAIKANGLRASSEGEWRQKRKELRQAIDDYAHENFDDWVDREGAVYFWTRIQDAERFAELSYEYDEEYVILTVDLSSYTVWATDNQLIEQIFEGWMTEGEVRDEVQKLTELESDSYEWDGKQRKGYELWCQTPISPDHITDIR